MMIVWEILKKLLGLGAGSALNNAGGLVNHAALVAAGSWAVKHWADTVTFTASVGTLSLVVAGAWFVLEANRRSRPQ